MNRIKEIRMQKEMTQTALARAAGVSSPFLHDLEAGKRNAKPATMRRIASALGCPVEYLTGNREGGRDDGQAS